MSQVLKSQEDILRDCTRTVQVILRKFRDLSRKLTEVLGKSLQGVCVLNLVLRDLTLCLRTRLTCSTHRPRAPTLSPPASKLCSPHALHHMNHRWPPQLATRAMQLTLRRRILLLPLCSDSACEGTSTSNQVSLFSKRSRGGSCSWANLVADAMCRTLLLPRHCTKAKFLDGAEWHSIGSLSSIL